MHARALSWLLCLALTPAAAQDVAIPEAWVGAQVQGRAGQSVANLGDLDGDGIDDLAWSEPFFTVDHVTHGRVVVRSGGSGATLALLDGTAGGDRFGHALAGGGDFDGDGVPDLAVGSPRHDGAHANGGLVTVYSGADFRPLMSFLPDAADDLLGTSVAFVADLDGDGDDELLAGAPHLEGTNQPGYARLFDGGTGAVLATFGFGAGGLHDLLGTAVADVGDVDDDGFTDLGVGAPGSGLVNARVLVYSGGALVQGQGLVPLLDMFSGVLFDSFGFALDSAGDVDGDGHDDVLVGNPNLPGHDGQVTVNSGADGAELLRFDGTHFSRLGGQVAGVSDLDGDGVPDLAATGIGSQFGEARGLARAWSAADGTLLVDVPYDADILQSFGGLAPGGDHDGDGRPELVFGMLEIDDAKNALPGRGKLLRVERGEPLVYKGLGMYGAQGLPVLAASGDLTAGSPVALEVLGGLPTAPLFFVVGVSELVVPLEGGYLVPSPDLVIGLALDADGGLALGGAWPAGVPSEVTVSFQGWIVDASGPFGFTATNGTTAITP